LIKRGVNTTLVVDKWQQRVDDRLQSSHLAMPQQVLEDRMLRLFVEGGQRVSIRRIPGFDALRLG
jgi:hypothetical protein